MRVSNHWPDVQQIQRIAALVLQATAHRDVTSRIEWNADSLSVSLAPLPGGLESTAVARVRVTVRDGAKHCGVSFVAKRLHDDGSREAAVYRWLTTSVCAGLAPRAFAIEPAPDGSQWLFLEALTPMTRWPWRQIEHVTTAIHSLAFLHQRANIESFQAVVPDLGYEMALARRGLGALESFDAAARSEASLRAFGPALRRIVDSLSMLRRQLMAGVPFAPSVLHGDVHSRNLLICRRGPTADAVFADWARARCGSPLEDLSSWLHSLGFWEPEVRRRHDTLVKRYFDARGAGHLWTRAARDAYWVASASNALAGSLEYYLDVMVSPAATRRQRAMAGGVAREWLRIIRRADAVWRTRGGGRPAHQRATDRRTTTLPAMMSSDHTRPL